MKKEGYDVSLGESMCSMNFIKAWVIVLLAIEFNASVTEMHIKQGYVLISGWKCDQRPAGT